MQDKKAALIPEATYHVYNRANGTEKLFVSTENYRFFLEKYKQYISPVANTFCYCLMPNHFHFLVRIKSEKELIKIFDSNLTGFQNLSGLIAKEFSNLFNSYSKAFNKQENRKGSLFMRPFKRKIITDQSYLRKLVHYIHYNPVEAALTNNPEEWKHSSYSMFLDLGSENDQGWISREEVTEWFGDRENFMYCHRFHPKETGINIF